MNTRCRISRINFKPGHELRCATLRIPFPAASGRGCTFTYYRRVSYSVWVPCTLPTFVRLDR